MEPFFRFFIKFQGYFIGITCIFGNIMSMIDAHFVLHYPHKDFFDYRYMGKTALFFNLLWIAVGIATIYGVYQKIRKFLYPLAILFTLDLFLLILRDIVVIWIDHPWAHVNLLWPFSAVQIIYASLHVMTTLVALGKLIDQETSAQSGPNFVRFKVDRNRSEEFVTEDNEVLAG
ncbi:uncharacterized protein LOC120432621 [Culex pipiens pallens]|uniref:uncharacterized protein LOC120432621 n=1 Tax=Culex pipiens pallens TaxID=42434 RepID=UPI0019537CF6|nr:uncharacterized protein LOC120432621 [Culex pipiens pallens]